MPEEERSISEVVSAIKDWIQSSGGPLLNLIYPVGSIYMSTSNVSPSVFIGGEWEALDDGRVLIGAGSAHPAGETGGEEEHTLSEGEIPSHNHNGSLSGSTKSAGSHSHSRGDMNISGTLKNALMDVATGSGAFSVNTSSVDPYGGGSAANTLKKNASFSASRSWSGSTSSAGSHSHSLSGVSVTTSAAGGGQAHNNMPPYLSVYMWKRTA